SGKVAAQSVIRCGYRVSNMNANVSRIRTGSSSTVLWWAYDSASGPCGVIELCRLIPPGTKPCGLASYTPRTRPMNSLITFWWNHGGRKVFSATIQRSGKITKSTFAVPGVSDGLVSTVMIDGSAWSNSTGPTGEYRV